MLSESQERPDRESVIELDRKAWNLPSPPLAPAGPVRSVWPVTPTPAREERPSEDPAAA